MWSPGRSELFDEHATNDITEDADTSLFAQLAAANDDEKHLILWRGDTVFVIMNLFPYNNGHLMIVPYREVAEYEKLTAPEQVEMSQTISRCIKWLKKALKTEGFNVGMNLGKAAGAGIPRHIHMHVVSRWRGDTNFMPTVA